jgi:Zn-dependent protease
MFGLYNYFDRVRKHFAFSAEEVKSLGLAILVLSFVVGFDDGRQKFELGLWLLNFINCILVITLSVLVREAAHRLAAINSGHVVEMKLWGVGLGIALVVGLFSLGKINLLIYGGIVLSFIPRQRLGYFRYGLSYNDMAVVAFWGNISSLLLALFFKIFSFLPNPLIHKAMMINILFACVNMLPIPPLTGSVILFSHHRSFYVFSLVLVAAASILMLTTSVLITIIGSILLAGILALLYDFFIELK